MRSRSSRDSKPQASFAQLEFSYHFTSAQPDSSGAHNSLPSHQERSANVMHVGIKGKATTCEALYLNLTETIKNAHGNFAALMHDAFYTDRTVRKERRIKDLQITELIYMVAAEHFKRHGLVHRQRLFSKIREAYREAVEGVKMNLDGEVIKQRFRTSMVDLKDNFHARLERRP